MQVWHWVEYLRDFKFGYPIFWIRVPKFAGLVVDTLMPLRWAVSVKGNYCVYKTTRPNQVPLHKTLVVHILDKAHSAEKMAKEVRPEEQADKIIFNSTTTRTALVRYDSINLDYGT